MEELTQAEEKLIPFQAMFGEISDKEIAKLAKVRKNTLESFKEKMGIKATLNLDDEEDIFIEEPADTSHKVPERQKEVVVHLKRTVKIGSQFVPRSIYKGPFAEQLLREVDPKLIEEL